MQFFYKFFHRFSDFASIPPPAPGMRDPEYNRCVCDFISQIFWITMHERDEWLYYETLVLAHNHGDAFMRNLITEACEKHTKKDSFEDLRMLCLMGNLETWLLRWGGYNLTSGVTAGANRTLTQDHIDSDEHAVNYSEIDILTPSTSNATSSCNNGETYLSSDDMQLDAPTHAEQCVGSSSVRHTEAWVPAPDALPQSIGVSSHAETEQESDGRAVSSPEPVGQPMSVKRAGKQPVRDITAVMSEISALLPSPSSEHVEKHPIIDRTGQIPGEQGASSAQQSIDMKDHSEDRGLRTSEARNVKQAEKPPHTMSKIHDPTRARALTDAFQRQSQPVAWLQDSGQPREAIQQAKHTPPSSSQSSEADQRTDTTSAAGDSRQDTRRELAEKAQSLMEAFLRHVDALLPQGQPAAQSKTPNSDEHSQFTRSIAAEGLPRPSSRSDKSAESVREREPAVKAFIPPEPGASIEYVHRRRSQSEGSQAVPMQTSAQERVSQPSGSWRFSQDVRNSQFQESLQYWENHELRPEHPEGRHGGFFSRSVADAISQQLRDQQVLARRRNGSKLRPSEPRGFNPSTGRYERKDDGSRLKPTKDALGYNPSKSTRYIEKFVKTK
ncbi:hypothetical protein EK21DRAFT_113159 [Setomelanomma holmii]|uniref:Uncharacterized protein n=1 Tax=Setomelanomma holmii TaxID=210430 RepID=A0A9P4LLJ3_9PLEO|nr:hypothetical protein EK21DRAFT_113159 [Setomelanomma holmii]